MQLKPSCLKRMQLLYSEKKAGEKTNASDGENAVPFMFEAAVKQNDTVYSPTFGVYGGVQMGVSSGIASEVFWY